MLWQTEPPQEEAIISKTVVDLVFDIDCRCLPVEHAYALSQAIPKALPWFESEPLAGLHLIHGAESGNGWCRPEGQDALFFLSRRTKLMLRLPQHRLEDARALKGMTLDIVGNSLKIGVAKEKAFNPMPVLFARYVIAKPEQEEDIFIDEAVAKLQQIGIQCRKALCGKTHRLQLPDDEIFTRSLMIADLTPPESITLQQQGLGEGRKMGCGLFVPHKKIGV